MKVTKYALPFSILLIASSTVGQPSFVIAGKVPTDARIRFCPVKINEIMVQTSTPESMDEWIELYNTSDTTSVDIDGWTISDGEETDTIVDYWPSDIYYHRDGTVIPPGGYALIVAPEYMDDLEWTMLKYADIDKVITVTVDIHEATGADLTIGDGLDAVSDSITITTDYRTPLTSASSRYQTLSLSWSAADSLYSYLDVSWDRDSAGLWGHSSAPDGCSPGYANP